MRFKLALVLLVGIFAVSVVAPKVNKNKLVGGKKAPHFHNEGGGHYKVYGQRFNLDQNNPKQNQRQMEAAIFEAKKKPNAPGHQDFM